MIAASLEGLSNIVSRRQFSSEMRRGVQQDGTNVGKQTLQAIPFHIQMNRCNHREADI
jgi:hypothetical protein